MQILHIIPSLRPGGAEELVCALSATQARRHHDVRILTGQVDIKFRQFCQDNGVELVELGEADWLGFVGRFGRWALRNRDKLAALDVIHAHLSRGSASASLGSVLLQGARTRPVVVETDHMNVTPKLSTRLALRASRLRRSALVGVGEGHIFSTLPTRQCLQYRVPNGISPLSMREGWGESSGSVVLGSLGMLRRDRSPHLYLDLVAHLAKTKDVRWVFGGAGEMRAELEEMAGRRGLSSLVSFRGLITDKEAFLRELDLHVGIAAGPDVGLATLEAASTATPSFGLQTRKDWINIESPFPVGRDTEQLAEMMKPYIVSPSNREALGRAQRKHVLEERTVTAMADAYDQVYVDVLERERGRNLSM